VTFTPESGGEAATVLIADFGSCEGTFHLIDAVLLVEEPALFSSEDFSGPMFVPETFGGPVQIVSGALSICCKTEPTAAHYVLWLHMMARLCVQIPDLRL
jgi:hypothetical protein